MSDVPAPYPYIDIYNDPDWRAKAAPLVEQARAKSHAALMQVVDLLENGGDIEDCDAKRLYDALQRWIYQREECSATQHILRNTLVIEGGETETEPRQLTYEELERHRSRHYGPGGKPPRPDAPLPVRRDYRDFLRLLVGGDPR